MWSSPHAPTPAPGSALGRLRDTRPNPPSPDDSPSSSTSRSRPPTDVGHRTRRSASGGVRTPARTPERRYERISGRAGRACWSRRRPLRSLCAAPGSPGRPRRRCQIGRSDRRVAPQPGTTHTESWSQVVVAGLGCGGSRWLRRPCFAAPRPPAAAARSPRTAALTSSVEWRGACPMEITSQGRVAAVSATARLRCRAKLSSAAL